MSFFNVTSVLGFEIRRILNPELAPPTHWKLGNFLFLRDVLCTFMSYHFESMMSC